MITHISEIVASVNVPTGYMPEATAHYTEILAYVRDTADRIMVNNGFWMQQRCADAGEPFISRPGYDFRFWFDDSDSAKRFANIAGGIVENPPVLPRTRYK